MAEDADPEAEEAAPEAVAEEAAPQAEAEEPATEAEEVVTAPKPQASQQGVEKVVHQ